MKIISILIFVITNVFAQKTILTPEILWNIQRVNNYSVSLNENLIALEISNYSIKENEGYNRIDIFDENFEKIKTIENGSSLTFIKNDEYLFLLEGQLYLGSLRGETKKLTNFYTDINSYFYNSENNSILFNADIYPECLDADCFNKISTDLKNKKSSEKLLTSLMFRHWNNWRNDKFSHVFYHELGTNIYRDLLPNLYKDSPPISLGSSKDFSLSPDGKVAAFTSNFDDFVAISTNNDIFFVNLLQKSLLPKKISESLGNDNQPIFSNDGKYLAYTSMKRPGFEADKQNIILYDLKNNDSKILIEDFPYSAKEILWDNTSENIFFTADKNIYHLIFKLNIKNGSVDTLVSDGYNYGLTISKNNNLYFLRQSNQHPTELFSISNNEMRKISDVNEKLIENIEFGEFTDFYSYGAENTPVQSILIKPPFFDKNKKYPMIFLVHGGPQGNWSDNFHFRWNLQLFSSYGYVVIAPNPRGSTGYGQKFTDEISGDWGGKVFIDLMNTYDNALEKFSFIDKDNTFSAGASYGGYMMNWFAGHTDKFNALICHAGVFNLESMYGTTEELWFPEWENKGTPWENRELYDKWSPHNYVSNFKTPMLVIHGANDFRVPESQGFELFTSLQRMGIKSKFLYYPDEYHFVVKPANALVWWNTIFEWIEENKK